MRLTKFCYYIACLQIINSSSSSLWAPSVSFLQPERRYRYDWWSLLAAARGVFVCSINDGASSALAAEEPSMLSRP